MKKMEDQLERIESKVDKLDERLDKVDVHMAKYNLELEFHVSRVTQVEDELLPIARHVEQLRGAFKLAAWLFGTALTILLAYWGLK
jgi:septation ring formation regulator EzrA